MKTIDIETGKKNIDLTYKASIINSISKEYYPIGIALHSINVEYTNEEIIAYIQKKEDDTLSIKINPKYMFSKRFTAFTMYHEIFHALCNHYDRSKNKDMELWNIATDYVINNRMFKSDFFLKIKDDDGIEIIKEIKGLDKNKNYTEEEVYKHLLSDKNKFNSLDNILQDIKETKKNDSKNISANIKKYVRNGVAIKNIKTYNKGNENIKIKQFIQENTKVNLPWNEILYTAINNSIIDKEYRTWTKPNIYMRNKYKFPGVTEIESDYKDTMIIAIDQSQSMENEIIAKGFTTIKKLSNNFKNIRIIHHDTKITYDKTFTEDSLKKLNINVRTSNGGTSHIKIFEEIEKTYKENKDSISLIILWTDLEPDITDNMQYNFIKNIPIITITNTNNISKIGKTIKINE